MKTEFLNSENENNKLRKTYGILKSDGGTQTDRKHTDDCMLQEKDEASNNNPKSTTTTTHGHNTFKSPVNE